MKVVICENKHYYDADTYDACPHCGAQPVQKYEEENKKGKPYPRTLKLGSEIPAPLSTKDVYVP